MPQTVGVSSVKIWKVDNSDEGAKWKRVRFRALKQCSMRSVAMPVFPSHVSAQYQDLYRATVQEAVVGGGPLMAKLVAAGRAALQVRETVTRDVQARNALADSAKQLRQWESELCKRYPKALSEAFSNPQGANKTKGTSPAQLQFDELELMDDVQVQTSVTLARTQQVAMLTAEASLAELNTLICSTLGLSAVQPERNPLRPESYVRALREVIEQTNLPEATQLDWLSAMTVHLGEELRDLYVQLSSKLCDEGVVAAGYAISQAPVAPGAAHSVAQDVQHPAKVQDAGGVPPPQRSASLQTSSHMVPAVHQQRREASLLTLDKLRRLLVGEFDAPVAVSPRDAFAQHFVREFEAGRSVVEVPSPAFAATVPAALEALQEMKQVDDMVQRLEQRLAVAPGPTVGTVVDVVREALRRQAKNTAQSLSLEVVSLMVDNIAIDRRLLEPVQQLVRNLEPALLRLALVDPRFFTDKRHPARALMQEITHRSMGYADANTTGFAGFLQGLSLALAPLQNATIESAEPFEQVLAKLQASWTRATHDSELARRAAVAALRHAEQRNLLAGKIAREIDAHPDTSQVPGVVMNFLCGPWSQVIAEAHLTGGADDVGAEKYKALVPDLLWSTHPALVRKNYAKLTRLVPPLLATLREGLETIHYPSSRTSEFLEALLGLHQLAFRTAQKPADAIPEPEPAPEPLPPASARVLPMEDGDPWVAPQEASVSNLMEFTDDAPARDEPVASMLETAAADQVSGDGATEPPVDRAVDVQNLPLGSWLELLVNGAWERRQLTWASPHGTLFLFTSASGSPQSMTRRSLDKLVGIGNLRVVSGRTLVDGALNAVAQQAMRNSVDTVF
jgi:hypothetical protein